MQHDAPVPSSQSKVCLDDLQSFAGWVNPSYQRQGQVGITPANCIQHVYVGQLEASADIIY